MGGGQVLLWSLGGAALGLALLLPLYAIGGMGAGDVKLLAGVGAWIGPVLIWGAFVCSALVGGVMALAMVVWSGELACHWGRFQMIGHEILTIRNPVKLAELAAARKSRDDALAVRDSDCVGSIAYLAWQGLLLGS